MKIILLSSFCLLSVAQAANAICSRRDMGTLYAYEGSVISRGYADGSCGCEKGDEIVSGGCYITLPPNTAGSLPQVRIVTTVPNLYQGQWIWVCGAATATTTSLSYQLHIRALCRNIAP